MQCLRGVERRRARLAHTRTPVAAVRLVRWVSCGAGFASVIRHPRAAKVTSKHSNSMVSVILRCHLDIRCVLICGLLAVGCGPRAQIPDRAAEPVSIPDALAP